MNGLSPGQACFCEGLLWTGSQFQSPEMPKQVRHDNLRNSAEKYDILKQNRALAAELQQRLVKFLNRYYAEMPSPPEIYQATVEERLMN